MHSIPGRAALGVALLAGVLLGPLHAQEPAPPAETLKEAFPAQKSYSPYAGRNFPTRVFWGDTHLHTSARWTPAPSAPASGLEDAYRFARGEELTAVERQARASSSRPLDFLVIADHSDNMGFFPELFAGKPEMLADPTGRRWYDMVQAGGEQGVKAALEIIDAFSRGTFPPALVPARHAGLPLGLGADHQRGREVQRARPLHRLHRLRVDLAGAARQQPAPRRHLPRRRRQGEPDRALHHLSAARAARPQGPLEGAAGLRGQDRRPRPGHRAQRQSLQRHDVPDRVNPATGKPLTREYAETRARWEPLYEVTQIKGDGEAHPFLSPNDELAGYELLGQGQPQPERGEEAGDAAGRVRAHARSRPASSSSRSSASTPTSSA